MTGTPSHAHVRNPTTFLHLRRRRIWKALRLADHFDSTVCKKCCCRTHSPSVCRTPLELDRSHQAHT
jgi:hypothetical protein